MGLGEKIADIFQALKKFEKREKGKTPYGLVFHPNTLSKLIIECEKNTPVYGLQERFFDFCMGINVYSGEKIPQHCVKVAYSRQEVKEILKFGMTFAEIKNIEEYFRQNNESEAK